LDVDKAKRNISRMAEKARDQEVRFRPHFKTHQSGKVGEWFRQAGVEAITVSSVDMARYFAGYGWEDITIAFPVNWWQLGEIQSLAQKVRLGVLVESHETVEHLRNNLRCEVNAWVKVDVGSKRTGLRWDFAEPIINLANLIKSIPELHLKGLLTHYSETYGAGTLDKIQDLTRQGIQRMNSVREALHRSGFQEIEVSVGDTPGCSLSNDLSGADEIRPGNFVFYDAEQAYFGSCQADDIAVAVACPVVARHPERNSVIVYGGAIHLSKDYFLQNGTVAYGWVALPGEEKWGEPLAGCFIAALSQEHGMVHMTPEHFSQVRVGDWLCMLPAHSCLTVTAMRDYLTLDGEIIPTMNSCAHV
jgi:D-serine deaminase-like pyridoxal phosphate-dependent protein